MQALEHGTDPDAQPVATTADGAVAASGSVGGRVAAWTSDHPLTAEREKAMVAAVDAANTTLKATANCVSIRAAWAAAVSGALGFRK